MSDLDAFEAKGEPGDAKLYLFSKFHKSVWNRIPHAIRGFVDVLVFGIGPAIPTTLSGFLKRKFPRQAFVVSALATFVGAFLVQVIWAAIVGTFSGPDSHRLYLRDDWPNLVNFGIICPIYVGLSTTMLLIAGGYFFRVKRIPSILGMRASRSPSLPISAAVAIALAVAAANTSKYLSECVNPHVYPKIPWYITNVTSDGTRALSAFGIYYAMLNFSFLVIVLLALLAFCSMFGLATSVARAIRARAATTALEFKQLKHGLEGFILSYITGKLLVAVLILNAYTWRAERPRESFNLQLMGIALTFFGVFFASVPRYLIEMEWFRFKQKYALAHSMPTEEIDADDLRPVKIRVTANLLDLFFIGSFITSFWF